MYEKNQDIIIMEKPSGVAMCDVIDLMKSSYSYWLKEGIEFGVIEQSEEDIVQRIGGGICLLAYYKEHLVGTISYQHYKNGIYFFLLAVAEDMKGKGIATKLVKYVEEIAERENCIFVTADTSEKARWLLAWYCDKLGYRKYTRIHYSEREYNSICFRK